MNLGRVKYWGLLASRFLVGQGIIQVINLVTGLLLLRLLSIEEYALYTLANVMLVLASLGSNLGLTSALVTFGSQMKGDRAKLGSLVATVQKYRRQLFVAVSLFVIALAPFMTHDRGWRWEKIALCILFVIMSNWVQLSLALRTGVFDIHHDADSQLRVGLTSAVVRLVLTVSLCLLLPSTVLILGVNFIALALSNLVATRRCRQYYSSNAKPDRAQGEDLKRFVYPLAPGVMYHAFAGQISLLLLGFFGSSSAIAQVSALANYGRIMGTLGLINGFIIQPYFARINNKDSFIKKCKFVLGSYTLFALFIFSSSLVVPSWWLLLLGQNYRDLVAEIPLAVGIPLLALLTEILYIILISKAWTHGQYWSIVVSVFIQVLFIGFVGVNTARHALWLAIFLAIGNIAVLTTLLVKRLVSASPGLTVSPLMQE